MPATALSRRPEDGASKRKRRDGAFKRKRRDGAFKGAGAAALREGTRRGGAQGGNAAAAVGTPPGEPSFETRVSGK
jgi:hypothetical protein